MCDLAILAYSLNEGTKVVSYADNTTDSINYWGYKYQFLIPSVSIIEGMSIRK